MKNNIKNLSDIGFFDIKPGLDRIQKVLGYLANPQHQFKSVIIAGTNGKGSVAAILSNILIKNGLRTGLYTSPHLVSVTERLKINNQEISENDLDAVLGKVFDACKQSNTELSYFEIVTASAFVYFCGQEVDIAVLEVGMGGRWDATNVVNPLLSVITNISLDHTEHLGDTKALIAAEKAEIIKINTPLVSGVKGDEQQILRKKAESVNSKTHFIGNDFNFIINDNNSFNYSGININLENLTTNLAGSHQVSNTSLALASAEILSSEYSIDFNKIDLALSTVDYEGRFEILRTDPYLILDAAHNTGSAEALIRSLSEITTNKFVFLISMLSDKDHQGFISIISKVADKIVITEIPNERSTDTDELYKISMSYVDNVEVIEDYNEAYEYVKNLNQPVCITGSVYLIGNIKGILNHQN